MAVAAKDIPITRDDIYGWLQEAKGLKVNREKHIKRKIKDLKLPDEMVDTSQRDDFSGDETHVSELIIADLESYG